MDDTYILNICGEITWDLAEQVVDKIYNEVLKENFDKITVLVSSPGGDPDPAWTIYTSLKATQKAITTIANGRIYSAGVVPFLAGDNNKRFVYESSIFLFHPTTLSVSRDEERARYKVAEELHSFKVDDEYFVDLLKKTLTKATKSDIKKLTHATKSSFLNAEEAVRVGLASKII